MGPEQITCSERLLTFKVEYVPQFIKSLSTNNFSLGDEVLAKSDFYLLVPAKTKTCLNCLAQLVIFM